MPAKPPSQEPILPTEEDLLLSKSEAGAILLTDGRTVTEVIRCDPYDSSIVYLGASGRPMTAWLSRTEEGGILIAVESGWQAERTVPFAPLRKP